MTALTHALTFALIPAGVALLGTLIATVRTPSPQVRTYVEHFAAGVVAAVAAAELLPAALHVRSALAVAVGFGLGTVVMLVIAHLSEGAEEAEEHDDGVGVPALPGRAGDALAKGSPLAMVMPVAVDVAIDGFLLGLAFVAGQKAGILLALGFALEMLSLGLATCATCRRYGWSVTRTLASMVGVGACFVAGAAISAGLFGGLSGVWLAGVISFGLAALLYLVTEELLVEAHEVKETHPATAMFFVGFLVLILIEVLS